MNGNQRLEFLFGKRIVIVSELMEQNYYNMDDTHKSLLNQLESIEDEIKEIKSNQGSFPTDTGSHWDNLVNNLLNEVDQKISSMEDDDIYTDSDGWEKFKSLGKKSSWW